MTTNPWERFKGIVTIRGSQSVPNCRLCSGGPSPYFPNVQEWTNHYLEHGFTLLHVGSESNGRDSHPIIILGSEQPLPQDTSAKKYATAFAEEEAAETSATDEELPSKS